MALTYDPNTWRKSWQSMLAQQALTTGRQTNPRLLGELGLAELTSRLDSEREDNRFNKQLDYQNRALAANQSLARQQISAQKQSGMMGNLMSLPMAAMAGYKLGKDMGFWGEQKKEVPNGQTPSRPNAVGPLAGGYVMPQSEPEYNAPELNFTNWNWGTVPDAAPTNLVEPTNVGYQPEGEFDWMSMFKDWTF